MKPDLRSRLFHAWFLLSRPMTLGVRAIATDAERRVLLVKHTYVAGWHLPGGGVESGETVLEALAKELREEANAEFGAAPLLQSVHFNNKVTRRDHVVVYRCDKCPAVRPETARLRDRRRGIFPARRAAGRHHEVNGAAHSRIQRRSRPRSLLVRGRTGRGHAARKNRFRDRRE